MRSCPSSQYRRSSFLECTASATQTILSFDGRIRKQKWDLARRIRKGVSFFLEGRFLRVLFFSCEQWTRTGRVAHIFNRLLSFVVRLMRMVIFRKLIITQRQALNGHHQWTTSDWIVCCRASLEWRVRSSSADNCIRRPHFSAWLYPHNLQIIAICCCHSIRRNNNFT